MRIVILLAALVAISSSAAPSAHAQRTAYAPDGRPEFCVLADIALNRQASDELVGMVLDNLNISRYRGPGQRLMDRSQRLVGWLFYLYSQDAVHWTGIDDTEGDFYDAVRGLIRQYDGDVPALVRRELPNFDRALAGCRLPARGR